MLLVRGAVAVVFGIVAVAWPDTTIVVLVVLWGIWALVDVFGLAAQAFSPGASRNQRVLFGLMAVVALVVALLAITRPSMAASNGSRRKAWTRWPSIESSSRSSEISTFNFQLSSFNSQLSS